MHHSGVAACACAGGYAGNMIVGMAKGFIGGTCMAAVSTFISAPLWADSTLQNTSTLVGQPLTKTLCYVPTYAETSVSGSVDWVVADASGVYQTVAQVAWAALSTNSSKCTDPANPVEVTLTWTPTQPGTYTSAWCLRMDPYIKYLSCTTAETITVTELPVPSKPDFSFQSKKRSIKLTFESRYASSYRVTFGKKTRTVSYTSTTFTGLKPGTRYKTCVTAINDQGESKPACLKPLTNGRRK